MNSLGFGWGEYNLILVFTANNTLIYLRVDKDKNVSLAHEKTNHVFVDVNKLYVFDADPEKSRRELEVLGKQLKDKLLVSSYDETLSYLKSEMAKLGMTYKMVLDRDVL